MEFFNSVELNGHIRVRNIHYPILSDTTHVERCHWHDFHEMLFCVGGKFIVRLNLTEVEVSAGDIIIFEPGIIHESVCIEAPGDLCVVQYESSFVDDGESDGCSALMNSILNKRDIGADMAKYVIRNADRYRGKFAKLLTEYDEKRDGWTYIIRGIMLCIRGQLIRDGLYDAKKNDRDRPDIDPHIKKACSFIEQNYASQITLLDAAVAAGYSRTYFSKLFARNLGITFSDYLLFIRMYEAERLMWKGGFRIDEVASMVGYESVPAFYRAFRRATGLTPNRFFMVDSGIMENMD